MTVAVVDTTEKIVRTFPSYIEAHNFIILNGRPDWKILPYRIRQDYISTPKQRSAVKWVEMILNIPFEGKLTSGADCTDYLSDYLEDAKQFFKEIKDEYDSF